MSQALLWALKSHEPDWKSLCSCRVFLLVGTRQAIKKHVCSHKCLTCREMGAASFMKQARGPECREAVGASGRAL